jgi:hypothetical protein
MASISTDAGGNRTIRFVGRDRKRRNIRIGKAAMRDAAGFKLRVEQLNAAQITGHPIGDDTAHWLATIGEELSDRLAAVGLIPRRGAAGLEAFLDGLVSERTDLKQSTRDHLRRAKEALVEFLGADEPLREITAGDTDDFRRWCFAEWADNTARRACGRAKQFFRVAVRKRLITATPFADMKDCNVRENATD